MADPICRWRNTTPETVQLLVRLLPKREMPESEFKKCLKENCDAENFDYDGFLTTAYQLAVQIGLYFISDDGVYHPRFDHNLTEAEAKEYVARVATLYVSPNPYAKSMSAAKSVVCLYDFFVQRAGQLGIGSNIDVKAELANLYQLPMGNTDMIVNLLSRTGAFLKIDGQHVKYIGRASVADNKESYFKHFGGLLDSGSVQHPMNEETGLLRVGDHFIGKDGGAFTVLECLPRIYRIRVVETGKTRSVPKTVVSAWYEFYKTHPTIDYELKKSNGTIENKTNVPIRDAATRPIRDLINETTIDDKYEHCYDGMLGTIARWLLDHPERKDAPQPEPQNVPSSATEPRKVDRLSIALKLFQEARKSSVSSKVRCWVFSPGERACRWDEMRDGGYMALDYSGIGDLRSYADEESLRDAFQTLAGDDASHKNDVRALMDFRDVMKPDDLVFAKQGVTTFLAVGRVTGECEYFSEATDYKFRRKVEWFKIETHEMSDQASRKTLTDVTGYADYLAPLCEAYQIERVTNTNEIDWGCKEVRDWFAAFTPEKLTEDFAYFRSRMLWSKRVQGAIGREYAHVNELGAVMKELKESPRPIGYYASEEFAKKCPDGFGKSTATDFLMKFHPNEYISFTGNMMDALDFLGLWPKDVKRDIEVCYNELIGAATRVRNRMKEREIGGFPEGKKPEADYLTVNEFLWWTNLNKDLIKEKIMASAYKKTEIKKVEQDKIDDFSDFIKKLEKDVADAGLKYADGLMKRFVCAQLAKPFVVLTGLSGSGKTKLAEAFTKWIGVENTVNIVPVGADWTNNEKLLGYPNALDSGKYVMPDTGVLKLMLDANENPDLPFFLILDEMNLSHVERYFADFLSTMESNDGIIELYDSGKRFAEDGREIPPNFPFPKNLFVIGTMNVDETTYMFSPKVLDRAQVIEFRVSEKEMSAFLAAPGNPKIGDLAGKGAVYAKAFLDLAAERKTKDIGADEKKKFNELLIGKVNPKTKELDGLFTALAKLGAEFGYRSAIEMVIFIAYYLEASAYGKLTQSVDREKFLKDAIDAAVLQKLLPKLHGSLNRLGPVIDALISKVTITQTDQNGDSDTTLIYPLTYEKLLRMKDRVEKNGFTSFAEA